MRILAPRRKYELVCLLLELSMSLMINLLYVLKLLIIARATSLKSPNMGKKLVKSDPFSASVGGYIWSQKVRIFGMVKEKGLT